MLGLLPTIENLMIMLVLIRKSRSPPSPTSAIISNNSSVEHELQPVVEHEDIVLEVCDCVCGV